MIINNKEVEENVSPNDLNLDYFYIKDELNDYFWKRGKMNPLVRRNLLQIAKDFLVKMCIDWIKPDDIIMTGSLANYNWDENFSDIDLHIILDTKKLSKNKEFTEQYFKYAKDDWNGTHENIRIYGYPVEVYVQDKNEKHNSNGVYSLITNKWIKKPSKDKLNNGDFDINDVQRKAAEFMNEIEELEDRFTKCDSIKGFGQIFKDATKLLDKIKAYRKGTKDPEHFEMSTNNLVMKTLRREGCIERVIEIKKKSYDYSQSLFQ